MFTYNWLTIHDKDVDLEYLITLHSYTPPSRRVLSRNPSVFWISTINQVKEISSYIKYLVIQGGVGRWGETSFNLSDMPFLTTILMGQCVFWNCRSIVLQSEDSWKLMNQISPNYNPWPLDQGCFVVMKKQVIQTQCWWRVRN